MDHFSDRDAVFAAEFSEDYRYALPGFVSAEESGCVSCHTSLKELLKITSAIEASKPKTEKPAESKGEG